MSNTLEKIREIDDLISDRDFETAGIRWKELNLIEKLHTVKSERFFCFQSDYEMRKIDKGGDLEPMSAFHFVQKIRSEIDDISTIEKTKGYMNRKKNPLEIHHVREILVIKP
jgi:hypothetical protein